MKDNLNMIDSDSLEEQPKNNKVKKQLKDVNLTYKKTLTMLNYI